jgi:hypothetical protein
MIVLRVPCTPIAKIDFRLFDRDQILSHVLIDQANVVVDISAKVPELVGVAIILAALSQPRQRSSVTVRTRTGRPGNITN